MAGCACSGKAEQGSSTSKAGFNSSDAAMAELDMEHYDSDGAEASGQVCPCPISTTPSLHPTVQCQCSRAAASPNLASKQ